MMVDGDKTRATVSVLILALNEEANLPRCLEALKWCDDIVVVDSFSSDGTLAVAQRYGARTFQRKFDNFAGQRNFALDAIEFRHEWILHLDADEVVTSELQAEIARIIPTTNLDAFMIPSKTIFMDRWLKYSGMYPTYQVRLSRHPVFRFKQVGHGQKEDIALERVGRINEPYLHYAFSKGIGDWIDKHNRYSAQEAAVSVRVRGESAGGWGGLLARDPYIRRQTLKRLSCLVPFRPFFRFMYMYFLRLGVLDGYPGFTYCCLLSWYEYMISLKVRELMATLQK